MDVPRLAGRRVILEPLLVEHADALVTAVAPGDDVWRWMTAEPRTPAEMASWIAARRTPRAGLANLPFLQRHAPTGAAMGSTSIFDVDAQAESAEIGHTWLVQAYRGTGVNLEAKRLLLGHCFDALDLKRVQLVTDARNERSQRAMLRIGATREGLLRNWRRDRTGALRDSVVMSVTAREWPTVQERLDAALETVPA